MYETQQVEVRQATARHNDPEDVVRRAWFRGAGGVTKRGEG
jgi:hypothetical protein